ncbi:RloB family protein [uncultured Corynebacterium sp.]|uniref:RloB family protein n=1 Tax=uncultured Corynebacterium sp. TaxID=159447 RepID=UPI0026133464|nr:RloB family protein [uncultured Corynebacterium sp.]
MSTRNRRRGKPGSRKEKKSLLLVLQGTVTEKEYFQRLRKLYRLPGVQILTEPHSPDRIVQKSKNHFTQGSGAPYDFVFFVVDVDDSSNVQFQRGFKQARELSTKTTTCNFVVSNECFEVWLLAHYEDIRNKKLSRATLSQKLKQHKAIDTKSGKHLSDSFPIEMHTDATNNVKKISFDSLGTSTGTAIPSLVDLLLNLK